MRRSGHFDVFGRTVSYWIHLNEPALDGGRMCKIGVVVTPNDER